MCKSDGAGRVTLRVYVLLITLDLLLYEGDVNRPLEPTPATINPIKFRKVLYNRDAIINHLHTAACIVACLDSLNSAYIVEC